MKKRWTRILSLLLTVTMVLGSTVTVSATAADDAVDATTAANTASDTTLADDEAASGDASTATADQSTAESAKTETSVAGTDASSAGTSTGTDTSAGADTSSTGTSAGPDTSNTAVSSSSDTAQTNTSSDTTQTNATAGTDISGTASTETTDTESKDISGTVTVDTEVAGTVTVEEDKNDDNVKIKKHDKPYLALGANLTPEQQATVLALMGIDASKLSEYDVVYVNNEEEHKYLDSYIDSSKIGTKSLSSVVIIERDDGNGINISTNNISYCTVGMYKNALATAGIQNADIIVAAPFPLSGTAALVGVFKAYTEMTGDEIDEENIDAALNELVVTGALEANGADSDEIEGMIAYVKQAVVEHDLSDETEIREAIAEGCEKFDITLTEEEIQEVVKLMQKISELDLDLDGLLNAAQSIYDKISTADGGFWAKIRELLQTMIAKIKELF